MHRERRPLLLIPLAAFLAITPLIVHGCSCGHDFDFHLISWFEAARQLAHRIYPRWAQTPAWNAGEPRFLFYPPLSWLLGALLGMLMPWTWTPIAFTWIALAGAGLSLYYAVRRFTSPDAALLASAIYLAHPYMLYTAYERTAYAELLAAIWLPLALHAALRPRITIPWVSAPIALLWLTNAPAAVMGCYVMAATIGLRLILASKDGEQFTRTRIALNAIAGSLLGLGLAAFYLIPAAYERRFVQIQFAIIPGLRPWDNFLFEHSPDPEYAAVLHTASLVAVTVIGLTALAVAAAFLRRRPLEDAPPECERSDKIPAILTTVSAIILFLLTPLSSPVWHHLPELRFLQFPWRFVAVLGAIFGFALALAFRPVRMRSGTVALLCTVVFAFPGYRVFHQYCYPEDTVARRLAVFRSANPGTDATDEYTPVEADNDYDNHRNPGYWLSPDPASAAPESSVPGPAPRVLNLSPAAPTVLILNLRDYPTWHILRNGSPVPVRRSRPDGLVAIPLPAGPAKIEIRYVPMGDQKLGYICSGLAVSLLIALILYDHRQTRDL
ncbi:MAG TPA: hypothetical protein VFS41_12390 [Edaphobacter sp.]|nr:hypothetical protein [Edaphobacter sp.]